MEPPAGRLKRDFTTGPIAPAILALALPMMLGNVVRTTFSLVDYGFLGRLEDSEAAQAAVTVSGIVIFLLFTVFMGIATASTAMVARAIGAKDQERADLVAAQSLLLTIVVSVVVGAIGVIFAPELLGLLKAKGKTLEFGVQYLRIIFVGVTAILSLFIGAGIMRGAGDAVTPLVISLVAGVINLALDPILIFGLFGFPRLEVRGAAIASVTGWVVAFVIGLVVLVSGRTRVRLRLRAFRPDSEVLWTIVKIGIPNSIQMSLRSLMAVVLMGLVMDFGKAAGAAFGGARRLQDMGFMLVFGISAASATLVGQNLGAGKPDRARRSALVAMGMGLALMGAFAVVTFVLARPLLALLGSSAEVIEIGTLLLRITAPALLFAAVGIILGRAINGAGDTVPPMVITLIGLWAVQVPLAYVLSQYTAMGVNGIWLAGPVAGLVLMLMTSAYFASGRWKHKKI